MRSSWGCCWLVLAWVLLLEHSVSGQEGYEVAPLEEPDDTVDVGQLESNEPEDVLVQPEDEEQRLENIARLYREEMEKDKRLDDGYKHMAFKFMKQIKRDPENPFADPDAIYKQKEDSSIIVEKAYGNIIKFRLFLTKGDCKDEWVAHDDYYDYLLFRRYQQREPSTDCEKLDCVFTLFQNVKSHHTAVTDRICEPLLLHEDVKTDYIKIDEYSALMDELRYGNHISASDEDSPEDDTVEVPNDYPISEDDSLPPTSHIHTPGTPTSDGDTPDVHTLDDDNAN